ncbi:hypothetical protein VNO78_18904 [Psophocarpus tetragonolobus]|uniref:Uncharacterized protein n=1 Tax=Psophocarpus tetragonolobus TaxID=3891 RepID=A0AAN9S733_PSOTE
MNPQWDVLNPKWTFGSKPRPKNPHVRLSSSLFERAPLPGPGEILNAALLHLRLQTELRRCIPRSIPSYASAFFVYAYASKDGGNGLLKELSNCQPPPSSMREDSTPARYGLALQSLIGNSLDLEHHLSYLSSCLNSPFTFDRFKPAACYHFVIVLEDNSPRQLWHALFTAAYPLLSFFRHLNLASKHHVPRDRDLQALRPS